jgi:heme oxygenase
MMGGMATRSLELTDGKGVAFYAFDEIPNTKDFITDWYQRLNDLNLSEDQKKDIVNEANCVFDLNIGILEELEGSPLKAVWTLAINTLKMKLGLVVM